MINSQISHYKIIEKLGEGGMGVVYKAQDTKLDRLVALKFLPPQLAASEQDKARFVQEAKAAAALNHPNVCSIIDIQEHDGNMFIVMEFVEGQTLRQKTSVGQARELALPLKQAIDIGIQIADGLAAAHEKGIVHRDIKPENIMIRKDGIVQIMDFGLAKIRSSGSTITRLTKQGSTLGTAGYMSPEQVQGQETDHRSDIFSFGVLLYEILTGELPFKGIHDTALAYEIVNVDPAAMSVVRPEIDPTLDAIVLECLAKDPGERFQSVAEVGKELRRFKRESSRSRVSRVTSVREIRTISSGGAHSPLPHAEPLQVKQRPSVALMMTAGVFFLTTLVLAVLLWRAPQQATHAVRFMVVPPDNGSVLAGQAPLVSPDGLKMAFIAQDSAGRSTIWIRPFSSTVATPLSGTSDATYPFWSPDSRYLGFFQFGKLKKIETAGGQIQTIAPASEARGGSWSKAGVIVFAPGSTGGLQQVSDAGGAATDVTTLDSSRFEDSHRWPSFLPDGRHFIYLRRSGDEEKTSNFIGSTDSKETSPLLTAKSNAMYVPQGYLIYVQEHSLMAQPYEPGSTTLKGQAFPITENVGFDLNRSLGLFSASENGVLAISSGGSSATNNQLQWYDRAGKPLQKVGKAGVHFDFSLSPDEKRVVFRQIEAQSSNHDLWILDLQRQTESRFTFTPGREDDPVWSPDGTRILFDSNVDGVTNLYQKIANGAGEQELLVKSPTLNQALDWSPDGRYVLYLNADAKTKNDLWLLPMTGDRKPMPYLHTPASEDNGRFSPDGKWIAYSSNESGRFDIYVQSFPMTEGKWQVSTGGGRNAIWNKNGKEIFYISPDKNIMAVEVKSAGNTIELGIPKALFQAPIDSYTTWNTYARSNDGKRFLINAVVGTASSTSMMVIMNWTAEITK